MIFTVIVSANTAKGPDAFKFNKHHYNLSFFVIYKYI